MCQYPQVVYYLLEILTNFVNHPRRFLFRYVAVNDITKGLKRNKSACWDIPTNILDKYKVTFSVLADCINKSFETGIFPDCLKETNLTQISEKQDHLLPC